MSPAHLSSRHQVPLKASHCFINVVSIAFSAVIKNGRVVLTKYSCLMVDFLNILLVASLLTCYTVLLARNLMHSCVCLRTLDCYLYTAC